jgi:hypothetical protein
MGLFVMAILSWLPPVSTQSVTTSAQLNKRLRAGRRSALEMMVSNVIVGFFVRLCGASQIRTCPIKAYGSSSHRFTFCCAIRGSCGDQMIEVRSPRPVSPPRFDDSASPSLRWVPAEAVPQLPRYYETLRLLHARFAALRFPSFGDTFPALDFRSPCHRVQQHETRG